MHVDLYLFRKYTVFSLTLRTARPRMLRSFIFRRVIGGKCVRRIQLQSDTCDEKKKRISSVFSDYFWAWNRILCFSYSLDGANWRQRKKSAVYKWCGAISTETKPKRSCKCAFRITSKNSFCLFQFQGSFHRRSLRVHKRKKSDQNPTAHANYLIIRMNVFQLRDYTTSRAELKYFSSRAPERIGCGNLKLNLLHFLLCAAHSCWQCGPIRIAEWTLSAESRSIRGNLKCIAMWIQIKA